MSSLVQWSMVKFMYKVLLVSCSSRSLEGRRRKLEIDQRGGGGGGKGRERERDKIHVGR